MTTTRKAFVPAEFKLSESGQITLAFAQLGVIDRDKDVTLPGAIPTKDVPMSAYQHTSWDGALPPGRGTVKEADGWGVFTGTFFMDTDHGRNTYHTVKALADLQEWSYGYVPLPNGGAAKGTHDGQQVRFLKAMDIFEVSPVLVGAGIGTHVLDMKSLAARLAASPTDRVVPPASATFADHTARVLDDVAAMVKRAGDLHALRAKEGRVLSTANRDRIAAVAASMRELLGELDDLLAASEPTPAKAADLDALYAARERLLLDIARSNGVAI